MNTYFAYDIYLSTATTLATAALSNGQEATCPKITHKMHNTLIPLRISNVSFWVL